MGDESTIEHISGEHPLIQVVQHKPLPGRRWFAVGLVLGALAVILATLLVGLPLHRYLQEQARANQELDCRNRIATALQEAQATLTVHLAEGLTTVVRRGDTAAVLIKIDADRERVASLGELRGQSVEICEDNPQFRIPDNLRAS